ncbi:MAG: ribonuclease III domain-containing protein [Synechococcales cyanobacterium]
MVAGLTLTEAQRRQLSPDSLAYVGDAIDELHVRQRVLWPPQRIQASHRQVVRRVQAKAQAHILTTLWPTLTETEQQIALWGRNGCGRGSRSIPPEIYRQASAWETLLGYLSITDPQRLQQVLALSDSVDIPDY